jgi:hypothetical protein
MSWTFKEGVKGVVGGNDIGEWDIVTKSGGPGFYKVDVISIVLKWALTDLANMNRGGKLRSVLWMGNTSISLPVPPDENRRKGRGYLLVEY